MKISSIGLAIIWLALNCTEITNASTTRDGWREVQTLIGISRRFSNINQPDRAIAVLDEISALAEDLPPHCHSVGIVADVAGQYFLLDQATKAQQLIADMIESIDLTLQACQSHQSPGDALQTILSRYASESQYEVASRLVLEVDESDFVNLWLLVEQLVADEDIQQAIPLAIQAINNQKIFIEDSVSSYHIEQFAVNLAKLANLHNQVNQTQQATERIEQAVELVQTLNDSTEQAKLVVEILEAYVQFENFSRAVMTTDPVTDADDRTVQLHALSIDALSQAITDAESTSDLQQAVFELESLTRLSDRLKRFVDVNAESLNELQNHKIEVLDRLLTKGQTISSPSEQIPILLRLAQIYQIVDQNDRSIEILEAVTAELPSNFKAHTQVVHLISIANLYVSLEQNESAIERFDEALAILQTVSDDDITADTHANVGFTFLLLRQAYSQANYVDGLLEFARLVRENKLPEDELPPAYHYGESIVDVARYYIRTGQIDAALQLLEILEPEENYGTYSRSFLADSRNEILNLIANEYARRKQYDQALQFIQMIENSSSHFEDQPSQPAALINGLVQRAIADGQLSWALQATQSIGSSPNASYLRDCSFAAIAIAHGEQSQFEQALNVIEMIQEEGRGVICKADALAAIAEQYPSDRLAEAIKLLEQALQLARSIAP